MTPEALADLHARAFDDTPPPWSARDFAGLVSEPSTVLVTGPSGFALGRVLGPDAELLTLAVAPETRRQRHGTALVAAFEAAARARGAQMVFLEVAEHNAAARTLYGRCGYGSVGRRRGYYARAGGPAVDALVLVRSLHEDAATSGPAEII